MGAALKAAQKRERKIGKLAFDTTPEARKERLAMTTNKQWANRQPRAGRPMTEARCKTNAPQLSYRDLWSAK